jgi:AraC-like DNA-binding protein
MLAAAETARSFHFTTDDLTEPQRGPALLDLRERGVLPLVPLSDRRVYADLSKLFLPGTSILYGTLSGLRQEATPKNSGTHDELFFAINLAGRSTALQGGREVGFDNGEALLLSAAGGPFSVVRPTPVRFLGLRVSRRLLAPLVCGLDDRTMRVVPAGTEPLRLLIGYAHLIADTPGNISAETTGAVAAHLRDLIALALGAAPNAAAAAASLRVARLEAIKSDIVGRLGSGDLTVTTVAARHRVTPRYIHKLFESGGTTFTRFVLAQRLEHAYGMLRNPRLSARSISAIAYDTGFGDLSYFNRTFRRRYGATPSDIRNDLG